MYDHLRDKVSHRVSLTYEDGTTLRGYIAACRPASGPVRVVVLHRAEIRDAAGTLIQQERELSVVPSVLVGLQVAEGPSAQSA